MRARKSLGEVEAQYLIDALEADIDQRAVERERLAVEPAARGDRLAVEAEHRRGLDVVEPGHLAALVDNAAGEPAALVTDRDEALALCIKAEARQAAESAKPRGQNESAAILEFAEPHARPVAGVERGQRPGVDLDRDRRGDREFVGNGRLRRSLNGRLCQRRSGRGGDRKRRRCIFPQPAAAYGRAHVLTSAGGPAGGGPARGRGPGVP